MKPFLDAIKGLKTAIYSEWNLRFHLFATLLVIAMGWWLNITRLEWVLLVFCTGLVLAAEMMNTAIEYLTNMVSPEFHPSAGKVKDIAAGGVLVAAATALITGAIIFLPKLMVVCGLAAL